MPTAKPHLPGGKRRLVTGAIFAAAIALANAFGPTLATAEPNSGAWDVIQYDNCVKSYPYDPSDDVVRYEDHLHWCCIQSGGVWDTNPDQPGGGFKCVAPSPRNPQWTRKIPSGIATEPVVTQAPPRPISPDRVSGDSPVVTQGFA